MESAQPASPVSHTGLPPGVEVGGLGKRFVAQLIDRLLPALIVAAAAYLAVRSAGNQALSILIVGGALMLAWALVVWWGFAVRAAGPGMRLMQQQLVGFYDGRPIGWLRYLLRTLVFWGLAATGIGLVVMLIFLLLHPRKQGWHDLAAQAVVIKQRALAPPRSKAAADQRPAQRAVSETRQDQLAATSAPHGSQQYPTPQPLTPPPGVDANYSSMPGPPPGSGGGPPYGNPYADAEPQPPATDYSAASAGSNPYRAQPGEQAPIDTAAVGGAVAPQPVAPRESVPPSGAQTGRSGFAASPGEAPLGDEAATSTARVRQVAVPGPRDEHAQTGWVAVLDDGREIPVNGLVLLGRNPQPHPGEEDAQLIKIADETRTVSKSHLAVSTDADGAFVVDRGSTNGSIVTTSSGVSTRCQIGERVRVAQGSIVSIGDHWLEMRRRLD